MVVVMPLSLNMNGGAPPETAAGWSVAVAVKGVAGDPMGGGGSRRAVRWAVENLLNKAESFLLVHVIPTINSIPTPTGERIPMTELDESVVKMYVRDMKREFEQVFVPFKRICKNIKVETLLLEHDDPAKALLRFISETQISSLVMGSCSSNVITRRMKGPGVPSTVLRYAPEKCEVYVICRDRIVSKSVDLLSNCDTSPRMSDLDSCRDESSVRSSVSRYPTPAPPPAFSEMGNRRSASAREPHIEPLSRTYKPNPAFSSSEIPTIRPLRQTVSDKYSIKPVMTRTGTQKVDVKIEVERLKKELESTVSKYKQACEELFNTQKKVRILSSECIDEAKRVNAALEKEETMRKTAALDKERHLQAMQEVEAAKAVLAKELCERQIAEMNSLNKHLEKQKIIEKLISVEGRCRRYTKEEIEKATGNFSAENVIGQGGYGKVYRCSLDHTPVAVKVLKPDSLEKKEEFLKEVEVLRQLRHPHVVLLLGACPEIGCLVYEHLENGSLQDYIYHRNNKPPLPWFIRFRIILQTACGLAFLHSSKPEPIVHRDLKPGNILLDRNYVTKIGDVGLAKLVTDVVPDDVTQYRHSVLAGTLYYMDPEYQRTGTVRPKSDVYAFGIIILQLLTARHPNGLLMTVEDSVKKGTLTELLDKSVTDWPLVETEELARIGLKCSQIRCRDRPDLEKEVIPILKRIVETANGKIKKERNVLRPPSHYFCPILKEIMEDPYIASDGFTYERRAITSWLEKHNISAVTKQRLKHFRLTPNNTLRSAIQDWRSRVRLFAAS